MFELTLHLDLRATDKEDAHHLATILKDRIESLAPGTATVYSFLVDSVLEGRRAKFAERQMLLALQAGDLEVAADWAGGHVELEQGFALPTPM